MLDELVRPTDADDRGLDILIGQVIANDAAVTALQHVVLDGHNNIRRLGEKLGGPGINRLGEARVDDRSVDVF